MMTAAHDLDIFTLQPPAAGRGAYSARCAELHAARTLEFEITSQLGGTAG